VNRLITASEKTAAFTGPTCPDSTSVWCRQFSYDAPGNRTTAGRSPGGSEAWDVSSISSISSTTNKILDAGWSYDAGGNVIGDSNTGSGFSVLYDAENRQVAYCFSYTANCTKAPGTGVTVYYYDGEGRRVEQIEGTNTTVFVYDAFGNLAADYGTLPAPPASPTEYVTVDDVGTTRLVTGVLGNVLERHDFEPFGHELLGLEGGWRSSIAGYGVTPTSIRKQFTGQERDDTGLDFFQARYFTSAQGRFASVDPANAGASLGDPQSWNGYAYVSDSPLRFTDPSGLDDGGGGGGGGGGGFGLPPIFGGGSSPAQTFPGPSTGSLDRLNPLLRGFNPCGGPSGTFGGGATGCPFVFSWQQQSGSQPVVDDIALDTPLFHALANGIQAAKPVTDVRFVASWYGASAAAAVGGIASVRGAAYFAQYAPYMRVAVGRWGPTMHVAYQSKGIWLHWVGSAAGTNNVTVRGAAEWVENRALFTRLYLPVLFPDRVIASCGTPANNCVDAALKALLKGWGF